MSRTGLKSNCRRGRNADPRREPLRGRILRTDGSRIGGNLQQVDDACRVHAVVAADVAQVVRLSEQRRQTRIPDDSARFGFGHLFERGNSRIVHGRIALRGAAIGEPDEIGQQQRRQYRQEPSLQRRAIPENEPTGQQPDRSVRQPPSRRESGYLAPSADRSYRESNPAPNPPVACFATPCPGARARGRAVEAPGHQPGRQRQGNPEPPPPAQVSSPQDVEPNGHHGEDAKRRCEDKAVVRQQVQAGQPQQRDENRQVQTPTHAEHSAMAVQHRLIDRWRRLHQARGIKRIVANRPV